MDRQAKGHDGRQSAANWSQLGRRIVLTLVLLVVAVVLVVGTQNFDEQASVHFLLWSFDIPLLVFFAISLAVGVLGRELFRITGRRRPLPPPPG